MPEMRNSKQIFEFGNRKCCLTFSGSKAFFVLEQRIKYRYVVIYVPLGHLTYFEKK